MNSCFSDAFCLYQGEVGAVNQYLALQILGLSGIVTKEQVKRAYRALCKELHPDDNPSKEAYAQYLQVQIAYQWMMTYYVFPKEKQQVHIYGNTSSKSSSKAGVQTGKIIGGCSASESQYADSQFRRVQIQKLEKERKQKQIEEQERKKKIWEAMQNAKKLPSQREAEKWKKIEAKREAERIAEIIKQLIMLEEINRK